MASVFSFRFGTVFRAVISALWLLALPVFCLADTLPAAASEARESPRILVMGDSISAGYGIQRDRGWVQLLAESLRQAEYPHQVVNGSISGETTGGGLARLPQALDTHAPEVVVIELGGNDGLRGYPTDRVRENLKQMVELSLASNARVLLVGMQIPPNYGPRYSRAFSSMYETIAEETGVGLVPFFLEKVALTPGLMQSDGIHPTAEAQPLLLETLWEHLEPLLGP
nr:lysophospholipase L1 [uncultured bacterium]BAH90549.1 lysophospholipase L1 [uncultured bacterium]